MKHSLTSRLKQSISSQHRTAVISTGALAYFANAEWRDPCICLCICLCFFLTPGAHAQGCAQCLDSTRATPPSVQAAYRHAIFLLGGVGATLFITGTLLLRRNR
jgi:hypothetical protein